MSAAPVPGVAETTRHLIALCDSFMAGEHVDKTDLHEIDREGLLGLVAISLGMISGLGMKLVRKNHPTVLMTDPEAWQHYRDAVLSAIDRWPT